MAMEIVENPITITTTEEIAPNGVKVLNEERHLLVGKTPDFIALTKVKAQMLRSVTEFFNGGDWLQIAPIPAISTLTGACEDFNTLFMLDYFGRQAFLIQTGQQHLETFIRGPIEKVYAINQSYRSETKLPERRLAAFTLVECEAAYYDLHAIQTVQEQLLYKICNDVAANCPADLKLLGADMERLIGWDLPLPRISYTDAVQTLQAENWPIQWGEDLKGEHERRLGIMFGKPFFVEKYPGKIKFFNMHDDPENPEMVLSSDLLVPGLGEIVGSSEREHDYDELKRKLYDFTQDEKRLGKIGRIGITNGDELRRSYQWYLDLRKDGGVPHAGFGLGFERLVQWVCNFDTIWAACEFPR